MSPRSAFEEFLERPVPPSGTKEWAQWQQECLQHRPDGIDVALHALEYGSENEQYAAALALRLFSYEVEAEGYDVELVYRVRSTTDEPWRTIWAESPSP